MHRRKGTCIVCALFDHQLQLEGRLSHRPLVHVLQQKLIKKVIILRFNFILDKTS